MSTVKRKPSHSTVPSAKKDSKPPLSCPLPSDVVDRDGGIGFVISSGPMKIAGNLPKPICEWLNDSENEESQRSQLVRQSMNDLTYLLSVLQSKPSGPPGFRFFRTWIGEGRRREVILFVGGVCLTVLCVICLANLFGR